MSLNFAKAGGRVLKMESKAPEFLSHDNLRAQLRLAVEQCASSDGGEENGGIITNQGTEYSFLKLRNEFTGTPAAGGLYKVDPTEYGAKIIPLLLTGWSAKFSFHKHPTGYPAWPSPQDRSALFLGFPVNFIYTAGFRTNGVDRVEVLNCFVYKDGDWLCYPVLL